MLTFYSVRQCPKKVPILIPLLWIFIFSEHTLFEENRTAKSTFLWGAWGWVCSFLLFPSLSLTEENWESKAEIIMSHIPLCTTLSYWSRSLVPSFIFNFTDFFLFLMDFHRENSICYLEVALLLKRHPLQTFEH